MSQESSEICSTVSLDSRVLQKRSSGLLPDAPLKLVVVCFLVAFSSMFQYGYASSYINTAQTTFMNYLNQSIFEQYQIRLSESSSSWIWSAIVNFDQIGFVLGTLLIPLFAESRGRRWCLLMSIGPEALGTCLCVAAIPLMQPLLLLVGRLVMGFSIGISCTAATLFLQECSPTHVRGFISSLQEFTTCISCVIGMVIGLPICLGSEANLSYLIGFGLFGTFIRLVLLVCPDTPKYLLLRLKMPLKAELSVEFYHGKTVDMKAVFYELDKEGELDEVGNGKNNEACCGKHVSAPSKLVRLWSDKHIRRAVILGAVIFIGVESTGIVPIYEYSTFIQTDSGLSQQMAEFGTLLMAICNTVSTFLSMLIVEKVGRRKLFLGGLMGIVVCLISLTVFNLLYSTFHVTWAGYGSMVSVVGHAVIFSIGPGPISWFITSELVPQHMRSSAQSFTQVVNMLANLCVSFVFFPLYTAIGPLTFVILCIVPTVVSIVFLYFQLPETKNREITDVVMELMKRDKRLTISNFDAISIVQKF